MRKHLLSVQRDGFYGVWYPCPGENVSRALILMLDHSPDSFMVRAGAKWAHQSGAHALAVSPEKSARGLLNEPIERVGQAIGFLKKRGCGKIGIFGASAMGMAVLSAAARYPDIRLTIAISPPDFVMEGYRRDGADGAPERPGDGESSLSWKGKPLPYLPYAHRHPAYWQKIREESKATGNLIAARAMFDLSERLHPLGEEELIKVERIHGKILCIGAEDDALWDTCKYISRMLRRLSERPHACDFEALLYPHGTHFVFPETMLRLMLPIGSDLFVRLMFKAARRCPKECRETRLDIDRRLKKALSEW